MPDIHIHIDNDGDDDKTPPPKKTGWSLRGDKGGIGGDWYQKRKGSGCGALVILLILLAAAVPQLS